jgi:multisubunit Na+/H+ antiporter MnhG subunit
MNKAIIVGVIMIIIAVVMHFTFDNDGTDFLVGLFSGAGLILLFTGSFREKNKTN